MVFSVHMNIGAVAHGAQAFDVAERELTVVRGLVAESMSSRSLSRSASTPDPPQHARHIGAELDMILSRLFVGLVHVIEAGELADFGHVKAEKLGHLGQEDAGSQPASRWATYSAGPKAERGTG